MTGTTTPSAADPKATLHRYLRVQRDHFLGKLDGHGERELRWPMTPTGTNLLGLVKHVASVQMGYLGEVFGRRTAGNNDGNLPEQSTAEWRAYRSRLEQAAEQAAQRTGAGAGEPPA